MNCVLASKCVSSRAPARSISRSVQCSASAGNEANIIPAIDRRAFLAAVVAAASSSSVVLPSHAEDVEFKTYYGLATPPTSYGGYGGNADEKPKYKFDYPALWKESAINKTDKGTKGIDCRISASKSKSEQVFVIALGRAGEDDKTFRLTDLDSTFQGFLGADTDLQDSFLDASEIRQSEKEVDGQKFFYYDIDSPTVTYLAAITVARGKIFAQFVKCPTRIFKQEEPVLRRISESFRTLAY